MSTPAQTNCLPLEPVFQPSDFSQAGAVAFGHAYQLALAARGDRRMMHGDPWW